MDIRDGQLRDNGAKTAKKPYKKPGVQVYGTLAQMTGTTATNPAKKADPSAPPSSGRRT
jgi:hypothetical protein